jgi:predicted chitinase
MGLGKKVFMFLTHVMVGVLAAGTLALPTQDPVCTVNQFLTSLKVNHYPTHALDNAELRKAIFAFHRHNVVQFARIETKNELAMFLAHVFWESGGLAHREELACTLDSAGAQIDTLKHEYSSACFNRYGGHWQRKGKSKRNQRLYYGRGYIQLTWSYNYRAASKDIFADENVLLDHPERVAKEYKVAWLTAAWFWRTRVRKSCRNKPCPLRFGDTTRAINGGLECGNGPFVDKAKKRYGMYKRICRVFGITEPAKEQGCYS